MYGYYMYVFSFITESEYKVCSIKIHLRTYMDLSSLTDFSDREVVYTQVHNHVICIVRIW